MKHLEAVRGQISVKCNLHEALLGGGAGVTAVMLSLLWLAGAGQVHERQHGAAEGRDGAAPQRGGDAGRLRRG